MTQRVQDLPKTLEAWGYLSPDDWRQAIWAAAEPVWLAHPMREELCERLGLLLDQVPTRQVGSELDKISSDMALLALQVGALMGYSLARTWPHGIEGLDEWIARAAQFSGLDTADARDLRLAS